MKSELPETGNLSNYRTKEELGYSTIKNISFERYDNFEYNLSDFRDTAHFKVTVIEKDKPPNIL